MNLTDKQFQELEAFLRDHNQIFPPTNKQPTPYEIEMVFYFANLLDPKGNHKRSSCGRCYYNARNVLRKNTELF